MKKILSILLSISIGLLFIFSAITKLIPMEPFEYQFVDIGVASWKTAPYIARIFIGIEFFIGFLLILNIALKKFTLKVSIAFLVFLTGYLIYKIIIDGNAGSCGCFGEALPMSPLEGIIKNVILIVCCIVCYFAIEKEFLVRKMLLLDKARKKTTQKVNLYEKNQIPEYDQAIKKIKRFMEDEENLAKSSQKILKNKLQKSPGS